MANDKLLAIIKTNELDEVKAKLILEKFDEFTAIAGEWETKARSILVTNENQVADMELARVGRLALRDKRIKLEKTRKELKEQSLREGRTIDGIANELKALIEPIETYLEQQEKFVEFRALAEAERIKKEVLERIEAERVAKEKAEAEERELIRLENERLKKEAAEREIQAAAEKRQLEEAYRQSDAYKQKLEDQKRKAEADALVEKQRQEKLLAEQRQKAETERAALEAKNKKLKEQQAAKLEAERAESKRLQELLNAAITCPYCKNKITKDGKKIN
jgi:hypothetical protein